MGKGKVAYFYDAEIGNYHYGPGTVMCLIIFATQLILYTNSIFK